MRLELALLKSTILSSIIEAYFNSRQRDGRGVSSSDERDGVVTVVDQLRHVIDFRMPEVIEAADVEVQAELGEFRGRKNEVCSECVDDDENNLTDAAV